ncbi:MAG: hypothetical protein HY226_06850 [Candidatus Vogelbacteria bacterium]|nr:hypothetical protein [Candidatus Vogelbacteria bacterium]
MFKEFVSWITLFVVMICVYGGAINISAAEMTGRNASAIGYNFGDRYVEKNKSKSYNLCPECGLKSVGSCECLNRDAICVSGHKWHVNASGLVAKGWDGSVSPRKEKNVDFGW